MTRAPRKIDDPDVRVMLSEQNGAMHRRSLARTEYVTDPDKRSVDWHFRNKWQARGVSPITFTRWSVLDHWGPRRAEFWKVIEKRVFDARAEHIVVARMRELEHLTQVRSFADEYLMPLREGKTGQVRRYPPDHDWAGLPMFALKMPSFDRFVKAYMDLDTQIMTKRGEVKDLRDPDVPEPTTEEPNPYVTDPATTAASFSSDELRAMARVLVRARQPELASQPEVGILVEGITAEEERDEAESHGGDPSRHKRRIQGDDRGGEPSGE